MTRWNSRLLMLFHLLVLNHPLLYPQIMPHTLCLICVWSSSELCPCLECAIHSFLHPHFATPQGQSQVFKFPLAWLTPPCPALLSLCSPDSLSLSLLTNDSYRHQPPTLPGRHRPASSGASSQLWWESRDGFGVQGKLSILRGVLHQLDYKGFGSRNPAVCCTAQSHDSSQQF